MKSLQRLSVYVGASLGAIVLALAVLVFGFGGAILDSYGKGKAERAFAAAHPGLALHIGTLDYSVGANCLVAQSVTMSATNTALKVDRIALTGVRWARLLWGTAAMADLLVMASLDATNITVEFPQARYGIRCARMRASVPGAELMAEGMELRPLVGDEELFAAHPYRTTRYHVAVRGCRVVGLAYGELLQGTSYRARSVEISRPSFDALVNCDKPEAPFVKSPLMVHEALAALRQPVQVDGVSITNGSLTYSERMSAGGDPGVLTFGAVSLLVEGIASRTPAPATIRLQGQGILMGEGVVKVRMTIPVTAPDFSLRYSGSLSAMGLTHFNAYLDNAESTRIKSGQVQEATFEVEVTAGQARGWVRVIYQDLEIAMFDQHTGSEKGWGHRIVSFLANLLKIRNSNAPDASSAMKEGRVDYTRKPEETFLQFTWFALRSGILDGISH